MKIIYIYIALFIWIVIPAKGQEVRVLDKSDLKPIPGVTISNISHSKLVITDNSGIADVSGFTTSDSLSFSHVSYLEYKASFAGLNKNINTILLSEDIIRLNELVITANRFSEKRSDLPYKMEVIPSRDIQFGNPPTSAIMLEQTGNVFVQQSQLGGGSPVLRGFEANKILLLVDGVRMNNAIYRAGHIQSIITLDPLELASTEILYGPGSVIHGSDALGGVIHLITQDPVLSTSGKLMASGDVLARFSSASMEKTGGFRLNIGLKKWGFLTSFSISDFGDLRAGGVRNPAYGDWGKCRYYSERINDADSMVSNSDPAVQKKSGYTQYNLMQKVIFQPVKDQRYTLNFQYSTSTNISRYDRLSEMDESAGKLKYAEWYYGPQQRIFASLKGEIAGNNVIFDRTTIIAAFQNSKEDRVNRKFGKNSKKFNLEEVNVFSLNADFLKAICSKDDLRYGLEVSYNDVYSNAHQENIATGKIAEDIATRYPDDHANMMIVAGYISNVWKINPRLKFSQGLRYSYINLDVAWSDTMMNIMKFPFSKTVSQKNGALNGYVGLVFTPKHAWTFSLLGSTGFRAPNVDDISKVNDSNSKDKLIIVPNPSLKPEYSYNVEFSIGKTILGNIRLEGSAFYTWLIDAIVTAPYKYNGQDSLLYDGTMSLVEANTNAGRAYVYGVQGNLVAQVTPAFSILSNLTWTVGKMTSDGTPLDHIPPVYGMTSFQLELKKFRGAFYALYNGWKRISQYSAGGEDNEAYATVYGMPSWYTLNLKASYQVNRYLNIEAGVENILDEHYRKFASGISSPGRNIIVALRLNF